MKHKSHVLLLLACSIACSVQAQVDTLGKCPFYYMDTALRHFLTSQYDSCVIRAFCDHHPPQAAGNIRIDLVEEYAIQMHTDDTIQIAGIALGGYDCRYPVKLTIYDSAGMYQAEPVPLVSTTMPADVITYDYSIHEWVLSDSSNLRHIWHPGLLYPYSLGCLNMGIDFMWLSFFEDGEILNMTGDFFVGISRSIESPYMVTQQHEMLGEYHDPPFHFPTLNIRVEKDKVWEDYTLDRIIPILFPIVEPACEAVEEVRVETDSMGCIVATWDSLPRQEQWVVELQALGSTFTIIDTVDACHWRYCGLPDGASYSIKVRSRCTNLNSYSWSDWNNATGVGIAPVAADSPFRVSPNPTHGTVVLTLEQAAEGAELTLCDLGGRELRRERVSGTSYTLDVATLPAGVYFLKLTTPQGVATRRLLVE